MPAGRRGIFSARKLLGEPGVAILTSRRPRPGLGEVEQMFEGIFQSTTIPVMQQVVEFTEARQNGLIKDGSLVLLTGFGAGYTWGSVLVKM